MFGKSKEKTFSPLGTDMHCHLLPGVDDGSSNTSETIKCLKVLAQVGFKKVHFTPHFQARYNNREDDIRQHFDKVKEEIINSKEKDLPEIGIIGGEYRFDPDFARRPGVDKVLTLPGNRLLCELSLHSNNYLPIDIFDEYIKLGYRLILAHPERYPYLGILSKEVQQLKDMGVAFQVNILSLDGFYGQAAMRKGFEFVNNGMAEYLGTDTHNIRYAEALLKAAKNSEVKTLVANHTFLNSEL